MPQLGQALSFVDSRVAEPQNSYLTSRDYHEILQIVYSESLLLYQVE